MKLKKSCLFFILFSLSSIAAFSQATPGISIGGADNDVGLSICPSHDGGYAIAGSTRSFGSGSHDFYFLIIDSSGQIKINRTYGWEYQDFFRGIIPTENGYAFIGDSWAIGHGRLDIYMMKTDQFGYAEKGFSYGTNLRDNGFDILQTNDKGFLILGHARLVNPYGDIYLLKVDADGNEVWQKSFYDEGNDYGFQIINSSQNDGYVFVGSKHGFFDDVHADFKTHDADILLIKVDENGNQVWKKTYGSSEHDFGYSVCNAPDGGYYLLGSSQSYGNGSFDMLLIKTDSEGNEEWHKSFGGTKYEYGKKLVPSLDGGLYLVGSSKSFGTDGSVDVFIVKTDEDGNEIWSETFGGPKDDFGEDIMTLPGGGCVIVGSTSSFGEGGSDVYLLRLKPNGEPDLFSGISAPTANQVIFYPNPMIGSGIFILPHTIQTSYIIQLYDAFGHLISKQEFSGNRFIQKREHLSAGIYLYRIFSSEDRSVVYQGKIIVQ